MTNLDELKRRALAANSWRNVTECWPHGEKDGVFFVGADDDGYLFPVAKIDAGQYVAPEEVLTLAAFYAAANPAAVQKLIERAELLSGHVTEWLCDKCRTIHLPPKGFDLCCKTPGCDGLLRPSSLELRRAESDRDRLAERADRAERALIRTGWTYLEGAAEWRPPVGPSASPLLEQLDREREKSAELLAALKRILASDGHFGLYDAGENIKAHETARAAIAKAEGIATS
ncbi:hypothetical protein DFP86_102264 [Paludibacterium purpuratum]|uniref:Ead/Ea22-like protein n=1 Tax=Paludibacterium purpuratum TaxID=1144873 RepID=A0A4R7BB03_9NEIS|nr:hypothetical protein DFP86_102264 [Paludibacterium purpuratum]